MFSWIGNIFHTIETATMYALLGAVLGFGCAIVARVASGFSGYLIAAAAGAVMLVGANWSGALSQMRSDADKQAIADLEAKNAKLDHDMAALQAVRDFEQKQAADDAKKAKEVEKAYNDVLAAIAKHADDKSCLSDEELDAIKKLQ